MTTRARTALAPALLFVGGLGFYAVHLAPTTTWGDSAGLHHAVDRPLGVGARDYPLFVMGLRAVRDFPTANPWYNGNLLTAFLGALTLVVLYAVIRRLGGRTSAALAGAVAFGIAHTVWSYSVITEVYTLNYLLMATMLLLLLRFRDGDRFALPLLMLVAGLALGHHRLLAFMIVPFLLIVWIHRRRLSGGQIGLGGIALLLGAAPLLILAGRELAAGRPLGELLHQYLTGGIEKSLFNLDPVAFGGSALLFLLYLAFNLIGAALPLVVFGAVGLLRRDRVAFGMLVVIFAAYALFSIGYRHHGIWVAYTTHSYLPLAILCGLGVDRVLDRARQRPRTVAIALLGALLLIPYGAYRCSPAVLRALDVSPFRVVDADRFHRWYLDPDQSGNRDAIAAARGILEIVPDSSVVIGDWGVIAVLRLVQHREGTKPHVPLTLTDGRDLTGWLETIRRPVFLAHFPHYAARLRATGYELIAIPGLPLHLVTRKDPSR